MRSSRNPNSVSGTFLWVQSKRDRLLSGLPETSTYTRGFHPRPANFLPSTHLPLPMKSFTLTHSNFLQPETLTRQIAHNFCVSFRAPNLTLRTRRHSYVGFHWCELSQAKRFRNQCCWKMRLCNRFQVFKFDNFIIILKNSIKKMHYSIRNIVKYKQHKLGRIWTFPYVSCFMDRMGLSNAKTFTFMCMLLSHVGFSVGCHIWKRV